MLAFLLVDPWAAQLPECEDILRDFDTRRSAHAGVLVPWETAEQSPVNDDPLESRLLDVLGNWAREGDDVFRSRLHPVEHFSDVLGTMIALGQRRLTQKARWHRRADGPGPSDLPRLGGPS
jgi:FxsC-like protein